MNIRCELLGDRGGIQRLGKIDSLYPPGCAVPFPTKTNIFSAYFCLYASLKSNFHSDNNAVFDLYLRQDSEGFVFYKKLLGQPKNINKVVSVSLSC